MKSLAWKIFTAPSALELLERVYAVGFEAMLERIRILIAAARAGEVHTWLTANRGLTEEPPEEREREEERN